MSWLVGSLAALAAGPLLLQFGRLGPRASAALGGFTFVTIAGLLVVGILPEALPRGGWPAYALLAFGLVFPLLLERLFRRAARRAHLAILLLSVAGLAAHAFTDGLAIAVDGLDHAAPGDGHGHAPGELSLAVLLHRFPVGLAVWYLLAPALGRPAAAAVLGVLGAATTAGFASAEWLAAAVDGPGLAVFEAFVAGSVLHVLIEDPGHRETRVARWPDRIGIAVGLALLTVYF